MLPDNLDNYDETFCIVSQISNNRSFKKALLFLVCHYYQMQKTVSRVYSENELIVLDGNCSYYRILVTH